MTKIKFMRRGKIVEGIVRREDENIGYVVSYKNKRIYVLKEEVVNGK